MTLGERFKAARLHKKLSQDDLADIANSSQIIISKLERGLTVQPRNIEFFAKILEVEPAFLVYGANPPSWYSGEEESVSTSRHLVKFFKWFDFAEIIKKVDRKKLSQSLSKIEVEKIICPDRNAMLNTVAIELEDDSMQSRTSPSFPKGSTIFIELGSDAEVGDFVLAKSSDGLTFKQLAVNEFGNKYLKPLNTQYLVNYAVDFDVIGVVICCCQNVRQAVGRAQRQRS